MKRGFTIVELVIVISVIAILAAITVVSYQSVQRSARLSKAIHDLSSLNESIKIHQAKQGEYPTTNYNWVHSCDNAAAFNAHFTYIDTVPVAPCSTATNTNDTWMYRSNKTDYKLIYIHPYSITSSADEVPQELRDTRYNTSPRGSFGYWSPGAATW